VRFYGPPMSGERTGWWDPPPDVAPGDKLPTFRYGAVFLLTAVLMVFLIVAPSGTWSRAVALALEGAALVVVLATSRERRRVRRARAVLVGTLAALIVLGIAVGLVEPVVAEAFAAVCGVALCLALVGGLLRLVRTRGVTIQAVAGGLAIYLQIGLIFSWLIAVISHIDSAPYFAQGRDGDQAERVYYSFTCLTTTGFGDFTAARPLGRALAVVEMLGGQLYLVTVIGVLVGGLVGRAARR
jgi:hypothetical protein